MPAVARKFVEAEARQNKVVGGSRIPILIQATSGGLFRAMAGLLKAGASPNVQDANGNTPLIIAIKQGSLERVQVLLEAGADPQVGDRYGQTALGIANNRCISENMRIMRILQEYMLNGGASNFRTFKFQWY